MYIVEFKDVSTFPYDKENEEPIDGCFLSETRTVYHFKTKIAAWEFFEQSLKEHYKRDYWANVVITDYQIESIHLDEGGQNSLILYKWEGFEENVKIGWMYNNEILTLEQLWEKYPIFKGQEMHLDNPFILSKDQNEMAKLFYMTINK